MASAESDQGAYTIQPVANGDLAYHHKSSGVKTWLRALDFAPPNSSPSQIQVLFHYVTEDQFRKIVASWSKDTIWSVIEDAHGLFGRGVYCSNKEASEMGSQEKVTKHMGAFCLDDWEMTNFCVPILGASRDCLDLRRHKLDEMVHGVGKNIHGKPLPEGADVWVFKSAGGPTSAMKSLKANCDSRLRCEVVERKERLGAEHPYTTQSLNSLIAYLRSEKKLAEAERYSLGSASLDRKSVV